MNEQDNPVLREILDCVWELPPANRGAFLDNACAGNSELRAEVELLLESLEEANDFLREPTIEPGAVRPQVTVDAGPLAPRAEQPGAFIGRYKLLQLIGEGGFGSVFMAEQQTPVVRKVALKIIKLGMDTKQVITALARNSRSAVADFFIAMAYKRLGDDHEARSKLSDGLSILERELPKAGEGDELGSLNFVDWVIAHVVRREAAGLINGNVAATKPVASTQSIIGNSRGQEAAFSPK